MNKNKRVTGILMILAGLVLIITKDDMVGIALSVFGIFFAVGGGMDLLQGRVVSGAIHLLFGVLTLLFGWVLVKFAFYVLGAILAAYGILQLTELSKRRRQKKGIALVPPIISILAGGGLLLNQNGVIYWVFLAAGFFLVIEGVLLLLRQN